MNARYNYRVDIAMSLDQKQKAKELLKKQDEKFQSKKKTKIFSKECF